MRNKPQTYKEYLATMKAYNFWPLKYDVWADWQVHYHGKNAKLNKKKK